MSSPAQDGTRSDRRKASDPAPVLNRAAAPIPTAQLASALTPRVGEPDKGCGDGKSRAGPDESSGAEAFPEGWALGVESWSFHRQFHERLGRPTRHREYSYMLGQLWRHSARVAPFLYRVKSLDGLVIVVRGDNRHRVLRGVMPLDWQPPPPEPVAPTVAAPVLAVAPPTPAPAPVVAAPAQPPPPPKRVLRPTTLTLGGDSAAAKVLAERLRRYGIPADSHAGASPP